MTDLTGGGDGRRRRPPGGPQPEGPRPDGEVYDWYTRGMQLLDGGHPAAASQLLARAADAEPNSHSIREGLARAQFDAEMYADALGSFRAIVETNPDDDYA